MNLFCRVEPVPAVGRVHGSIQSNIAVGQPVQPVPAVGQIQINRKLLFCWWTTRQADRQADRRTDRTIIRFIISEWTFKFSNHLQK